MQIAEQVTQAVIQLPAQRAITGHDPITMPGFDIGPLPVEPDDPSFPAGFRNLTTDLCFAGFGQATCRIEWDDIRAQSPPDPDSPR